MSNSYLQRHKFCEPQIAEPPSEKLGIVIVIPCFYEPGLTKALQSLYNCDRPCCDVEVIIVVNSPEDSPKDVLEQNIRTIREANAWILKHIDKKLRFHILHFPELPPKHAGVGLARKIGMDEAVSRLEQSPAKWRGHALIIVNFDADCLCEKNYLKSIESHFKNNPQTPACSIYYEHPLDNLESGSDLVGITKYELFLRYYVIALRYSGFPYAYYTIGSCMAVRSDVYQKQGGMNRRQAGEDFYFLQKIIQLGNFTELTATTVYPSSRRSTRVPFGTGKAISGRMSASPPLTPSPPESEKRGIGETERKKTKQFTDSPIHPFTDSVRNNGGGGFRGAVSGAVNLGGDYYTYDPKIFDDLKIFFSKIPLLYQMVQVYPVKFCAAEHFTGEGKRTGKFGEGDVQRTSSQHYGMERGAGKSDGKVPPSGRTMSSGHRASIAGGRGAVDFLDKLPPSISAFLKKNNFIEHLSEIQTNTVSEKTFIVRFYRWFNGLKVLQFVHFARDNFYDNIPVEDAAITLLRSLNYLRGNESKISAKDLLFYFRDMDKNNIGKRKQLMKF
ncbi:MAG: glycosyltransferase family 2 protein [Cytophagales bacterium]|nr:glycosyltransferase family 2 protein [Cytophagales bacterium]